MSQTLPPWTQHESATKKQVQEAIRTLTREGTIEGAEICLPCDIHWSAPYDEESEAMVEFTIKLRGPLAGLSKAIDGKIGEANEKYIFKIIADEVAKQRSDEDEVFSNRAP